MEYSINNTASKRDVELYGPLAYLSKKDREKLMLHSAHGEFIKELKKISKEIDRREKDEKKKATMRAAVEMMAGK